jgi:hypothetical protein
MNTTPKKRGRLARQRPQSHAGDAPTVARCRVSSARASASLRADYQPA